MVYCIWLKRKFNEQIERTSCEETPATGGRKLCKYIGNELLSGNWSLISRLQRKEADVWIARVGVSFLSNQTNQDGAWTNCKFTIEEPTMHQIGHWMWKEINTGEWKLEHAVEFSAYLWTLYKEIYERYHD